MTPIRKLTHKNTEWHWTEEHDNAMSEIKRLVTTTPILAYYDPSKELVIQCDASKSGLGTTLLQDGHPVAYASRALTPTEEHYAQIEKEALAIVFSLERFHQYTFGRTPIVESDHKPLESIVKKPLHRAPRRLQGMLMRMLNYDIQIRWKPGKDMHLADMLSRSYLPHTGESDEFLQVNMVDYVTIGTERLNRIKTNTEIDEALQMLKTVIQQGWAEDKHSLPNQVLPYFNIRDELALQDGILFRGERIVILTTMRKEMKETLHSSHLGIESTLRRARDCLFWPGMTPEIKQHIASCDACRTYETQNQKESLMPQDIPSRPWEKIASDIFTWQGNHYLVTVDYLSNFWEMDMLLETTSKEVIEKRKAHFSRYGIPSSLVSDNGPQYTSIEFQTFTKEWDFEHYTSSPHHSQSNGKAESAVKSAKRLLSKCKKSGTDPYIALLELRNTPSQGIGSSPVQRLQGRRTRTLLSMASSLLKPRGKDILDSEREELRKIQSNKSSQYNKTAKDLKPLEEGDVIRMKPYKMGDKEWKKAVVNKRLDERSYEIETPDGTYRRNRVHLKKTNEPPPTMRQEPKITQEQPVKPKSKDPPTVPSPSSKPKHAPKSTPPQQTTKPSKSTKTSKASNVNGQQKSSKDIVTTRSGRQVKQPKRLEKAEH